MRPADAYDQVDTLRYLANVLEAMADRRRYREGDTRRLPSAEWRRRRSEIGARLHEVARRIESDSQPRSRR